VGATAEHLLYALRVDPAVTPSRTRFPRAGDRLELLRRQSFGPTALPHAGDRGTVERVDVGGAIRVVWDCGSRSSVDPGAGDRIRLLDA
jgi:hypothetical protein